MRGLRLLLLILPLTTAWPDWNTIDKKLLHLKNSLLNSLESDAVSTTVKPHTVAIIGAGAAGSSAAFWITKAKQRTGVVVAVDIYEREGYVGGRSTVVYPYDNKSMPPIELGASIFVQANKNLWRATIDFNLEKINFDDDDSAVGFWDGEAFAFTMGESKGIFNWWNSIKVVWRYGISSPKKTQDLVKDMITKFVTLYDHDCPKWENMSTLATNIGFTDLVTQTTAEYLDQKGINPKFSREIVEAATRVNYGQNVDDIHALEGACSLAANGASSVKGGNFQIFENFVRYSGAHFLGNTTVVAVTKQQDGTWAVHTADKGLKFYNDVIIAAPFHSTGIELSSGASASTIKHIPPQPYVHLHVTLLTTTAAQPSSAYFGAKSVPATVLTTYEGVRRGGKAPEFNSLTYHGRAGPDSQEHVVKIFSQERLSDEWLQRVFDGQVGWVHRKEWDAYPELPPTADFPPIELSTGLYYVNAFEPFISTMETETIASRNVVDLLFHNRFGIGHFAGTRTVGFVGGRRFRAWLGLLMGLLHLLTATNMLRRATNRRTPQRRL